MQIIQFVSLLFLPRAQMHVHGHTGTDTHLCSPLSGLNHVEFPFTTRRITNRAELRNTCCLMELHMKECDGVREGEGHPSLGGSAMRPFLIVSIGQHQLRPAAQSRQTIY